MTNIIACEICPNTFQAVRSTALYCSAACRSVARRENDSRTLARVTGALRRLTAEVAVVDDVLAEHASPGEYARLSALAADARRVIATLP